MRCCATKFSHLNLCDIRKPESQIKRTLKKDTRRWKGIEMCRFVLFDCTLYKDVCSLGGLSATCKVFLLLLEVIDLSNRI